MSILPLGPLSDDFVFPLNFLTTILHAFLISLMPEYLSSINPSTPVSVHCAESIHFRVLTYLLHGAESFLRS